MKKPAKPTIGKTAALPELDALFAPAVTEEHPPRATAKQIKAAKSAARIRTDVANQTAAVIKADRLQQALHDVGVVDHTSSNKLIADMLAREQENTSGMTPAQIRFGKEYLQLKATAKANYEMDGGAMAETFNDDMYGIAIKQHGTAAKAWKAHMVAYKAAREQVDMGPATGIVGVTGDGYTILKLADGTLATTAPVPAPAPAIPTTGYTGPMRALRDRVKAGAYTKAANGQPSCGDEVAQVLGTLEPVEVIKACLVALDLGTNPYLHLNIGQQSMNLRNKLRGTMKRGELGMGVVREAVEVVMEARPPKAPAAAGTPARLEEIKEEIKAHDEQAAVEQAAPVPAPKARKAKTPRAAQGK